MPTSVQQDKLVPIDTSVSFENFNTNFSSIKRILHNTTDILKLDSSSNITYYQPDGEEKITYALPRSSVLDINYDPTLNKYFIITSGTDHYYSVISGITMTGTTMSGVTATGLLLGVTSPNDDFTPPPSGQSYEGFNSRKWGGTNGTFRRITEGSDDFLRFHAIYSETDTLAGVKTLSGQVDIQLNYQVIALSGTYNGNFGLHLSTSNPPTNPAVFGVGITKTGTSYSGYPDTSVDDAYYLYSTSILSYAETTTLGYITVESPNFLPASRTYNIVYSGAVWYATPLPGHFEWVWTVNVGPTQVGSLTVTGIGHAPYFTSPEPIAFYLINGDKAEDGDSIELTLTSKLFSRATASGTLDIKRGATTMYSSLDPTFTVNVGATTNDSKSNFSIVANYTNPFGYVTTGTLMHIKADNFVVNSGWAAPEPVPFSHTMQSSGVSGTLTVSSLDSNYYYLRVDEVQADGDFVRTVYDKILYGVREVLTTSSTTYYNRWYIHTSGVSGSLDGLDADYVQGISGITVPYSSLTSGTFDWYTFSTSGVLTSGLYNIPIGTVKSGINGSWTSTTAPSDSTTSTGILSTTGISGTTTVATTQIAIKPPDYFFITTKNDVICAPVVTGTVSSGYVNETISGYGTIDTTSGQLHRLIDNPASPGYGIVRASGIISSSTYHSYSYNNTRGGFFSYCIDAGDTKRLETMSYSVPPVSKEEKLFVEVPDNVENTYKVFFHGNDNNTLLYLRKHGTTLLNPTKITSSTGSVATSGTVITDANYTFELTSVKTGDLIIINKSGYASNGTYTIININNHNLTLNTAIGAGSSLTYTIVSNAELMEINADEDLSAFASVNVSDFNLRAGSAPPDESTVTAQVINAWGDPLGGKDVNFQLIQGDGVIVTPAETTATGTGVADTVYRAGATAGTVQIQVTITD